MTSSRSGGVPARPSPADSAIEKQAACAAATSSSGLVSPSDVSVRADQDTGSEVNAPDDTADTAPEPVARLPDQVASARRMADMADSCCVLCRFRPIVPQVSTSVPGGASRMGAVRAIGGRSGARTKVTGCTGPPAHTACRTGREHSERVHRHPPPRRPRPRRDARRAARRARRRGRAGAAGSGRGSGHAGGPRPGGARPRDPDQSPARLRTVWSTCRSTRT